MSSSSKKSRKRNPISRSILGIILLVVAAAATFIILVIPISGDGTELGLGIGDVATQDILAPRALSYESEVLTEAKQEEAAQSVSPQYASPDTSIARLQVNQLRNVLAFINSVRADTYAAAEQQAADLTAIQTINLSPESIEALLGLSDTAWQAVQQESISVLEQVMRGTIREDRLEDARRTIPALVSLSLPEAQADLVAELAAAFVAPNSLYSEELTETQKENARQSVAPITQSFVAGETVVPRGHVISASDLEALQQFGLLQPETSWKDTTAIATLVVINFAFIALYFIQRPDLRENTLSLILMATVFLLFLIGARLVTPNRTVVPYMFPVAGFGMLIAALVSSRAALILSIPLAILTGYGLVNSYELTLFYMFTSAFGVLMLRNIHRLLNFFWAGFGVMVSGALVILAFRLSDPLLDAVGVLQLLAAAAFNGLAAASLTILLQFLLAQVLGLTTTLQLVEISRPDHPLLQSLLRNAPGTYQHSLQIANLAEQAAERIGADTLLTRVGALYHDAGKVLYPQYFIENQVPGSRNPHDELSPEESAAIIIQHVTDGIDLAKKYRLPKRIHDFILEHHGTMMTSYQYHNAVKAADGDAQKVDTSLFTYPGPRPQSRETALVMLADGVEARARAERPDTEEKVQTLVKEIVDFRLQRNQLVDTDLTMKNIDEIIASFTNTLRGVYHPRIKYPSSQTVTLRSQSAPTAPVQTEEVS